MPQLIQILGKRIILTPFLKSEAALMLTWRNSVDYISLCSNRRHNVNLFEFVKELEYDFLHDRHEQYIIRKSNTMPIGTIFSYNYNQTDEYLFITTFLSEEYRNSIFGAEAHSLMLRQLFERYSLFKVYGDVYSHNAVSTKTMINAGYQIEGVFKNHRKNIDGTRSDLIRLSIDKSQKSRIIEYTDYLTNGSFKITPFNEKTVNIPSSEHL